MVTFKEFLQEEKISTSKRKTIVHFQDMRPAEFLQFAHKLIDDFDGKLENIPTELKVDGFGARFGKDHDGEFFFETSKSGPIQKSKSFSTYTKTKDATEIMIQRAVHYDELFEILKDSELWHSLPNDCKVFAEFLYNPMAIEEDGYLKFVSVKYNKKKLGKLLTIVPIKVTIASTGATHTSEREVLSKLFKESNHDIKIVSPKLKHISVDVSAQLKPLSLFGDAVQKIIKSLKHADKHQKQEYLAVIEAVKDEIAEIILQHPLEGKNLLGNEIEGIIIEIDEKNYKITTPKFKQQKKEEATKQIRKKLKEEVQMRRNLHLFKTNPKKLFPNDNFEWPVYPKSVEEVFEKLLPRLEEPKENEIPDFNREYTSEAGTYNRLTIWASKFFGQEIEAFVIFDENNETIAFTAVLEKPTIINDKKYNQIKYTWVKPEHRGKGFAAILYLFMVEKHKLRLICDDTLSIDATNLYKGLIKNPKFSEISFYNDATKEITLNQPADLWKVSEKNKWFILLENYQCEYDRDIRLFANPGYRMLGEHIYPVDELN